jgi:hypothetical protein
MWFEKHFQANNDTNNDKNHHYYKCVLDFHVTRIFWMFFIWMFNSIPSERENRIVLRIVSDGKNYLIQPSAEADGKV